MTMNRNLKIGVFAIVAFIILFMGINYLKSQDLLFRGNKYYSFYPNVNGLTDASPVYYMGYKVGTVRSIDICPDAPAQKRFRITITLDKPLDIPKDTRADIYSTDLLGGVGIDLVWGSSTDMAENGDTLSSDIRLGLTDQLGPLKDKATLIANSVDTALHNVNTLLGGDNGENLASAIEALNKTLENFERISANVSKLTTSNGALTQSINNLDSLMAALNAQSNNIALILSNLAQFSEQLSGANVDTLVGTLNTTIASMGSMINNVDSAKGSIGKLINDTKLYDKLAESSENLNRLLVDVRLNPSRYVKISAINFGKNTYFSDANNGLAMIGLVYSVSLVTSQVPLDFPTEINGQKVIEYHKDKKTYEYLLGQFREKTDAQQALNELKATYSSAKLKAFDSGKEVDVK